MQLLPSRMGMHKCVTDVLIVLCQAFGCPVTCSEHLRMLSYVYLVFQWSFGLMLNIHAYSNWSLHLSDGLHVCKLQNMCNLPYKKSCMWSIGTSRCIILVLKVRLLCSDSNYFSIFECCFYFALFSDNQHVSKPLHLTFAVNLHIEQAMCLLQNGPFWVINVWYWILLRVHTCGGHRYFSW